ncbi:MAG: hypothetical protein WCI72_02285 [archaeon]
MENENRPKKTWFDRSPFNLAKLNYYHTRNFPKSVSLDSFFQKVVREYSPTAGEVKLRSPFGGIYHNELYLIKVSPNYFEVLSEREGEAIVSKLSELANQSIEIKK